MTVTRGGQTGAAGVGGQQHRAQRSFAQQTAMFVEAQQHLRAAVDACELIGVDEIRRRRIAVDTHPVDLHRRIPRSQTAVGDEAR